jgi:hypothetical protein
MGPRGARTIKSEQKKVTPAHGGREIGRQYRLGIIGAHFFR